MTVDRSVIEELIHESCTLLDERDFSRFIDLCHPGFRYKLTTYSPEIGKEMTWLDRDRAEMADFFDVLPKHNSDQSPLTRIATVRKIAFSDSEEQAAVVSALQVYKTALDGGATELLAVGKYYDTFSLSGDAPTLLERTVRLDTRDLGWGYHVPF